MVAGVKSTNYTTTDIQWKTPEIAFILHFNLQCKYIQCFALHFLTMQYTKYNELTQINAFGMNKNRVSFISNSFWDSFVVEK